MPLRVVAAPDKFKGSLSALEAARAIARGFEAGAPGTFETEIVPMADGGEGTVDAFIASGAKRVVASVDGPLGVPLEAAFALEGTTAIVEMAAASGLELLAAGDRDPMRASTRGTGQLVRAALDAGARHIVVGLGGSATNDGGAGLLQALGVRLLDVNGADLGSGGAQLARLETIDLSGLDPRLHATRLEAACDVDNPLTGARGASAVFGPQKGAGPGSVDALDAALANYAAVAAQTLGRDLRTMPGAGAAGGLGFALAAFLDAALRPGVDIVAALRGLPERLRLADVCATGEGSLDLQTLGGKTVAGVARIAHAAGVRAVVAFAGRVDAEAERELARRGVVAIPVSDGPLDLSEAMAGAGTLLERASTRVARLLALRLGATNP
jgi:glycerate 2-kinase